ncbi:MAG: bifunctional 5,10-methylenetetrahydrofolate dehydrogenase/5,10-methenyltetrahydrofolate cyclohydrolase [Solirubrobacterales bacterium]
MALIYGKEIREEMKRDFTEWSQDKDLELVVLRIGDDPSSQFYLKGIQSYAKETPVKVSIFQYSEKTSEQRILRAIDDLNRDPNVNAVLLQKPFPESINENALINALLPLKDIEGIHPVNLGKVINGEKGVKPVTPKSAIKILKHNLIEISGKKVAILGRSTIVGSPLALMLTREDATVTLCHSKTRNLKKITLDSDIVVASVGKAGFVTPEMISAKCVLVDVGANVDENGSMVGDVTPEAVAKAAIATAVPGGVGVLTVAELFDNLRILYDLQQSQLY